MLRLIAIILSIPFLTGCTVVEPVERAALKETSTLAASTIESVAK